VKIVQLFIQIVIYALLTTPGALHVYPPLESQHQDNVNFAQLCTQIAIYVSLTIPDVLNACHIMVSLLLDFVMLA
jgi:hypothetical protein